MQYMRLSEVERGELMASLADMKRYLREAFGSLAPDQTLLAGPGGAFSPVEQVWHLADLEREGFGVRIARLRTEPGPRLPDFDGAAIARERDYRSLSLRSGLEAFERARDANIAALMSVTDTEWTRGGTQEGVGEVTLCDMPVFLRQHDAAHVEEIEQWKRQALRG
jgi:hypothetical protein